MYVSRRFSSFLVDAVLLMGILTAVGLIMGFIIGLWRHCAPGLWCKHVKLITVSCPLQELCPFSSTVQGHTV